MRKICGAIVSLVLGVGLMLAGTPTLASADVQAVPPDGYWMAAADGGVFTVGSATFYGSAAGRRLNGPVVGIAEVPRTQVGTTTQCCQGYWLTASDGGVFSFGSATFYGSMGGRPLVAPVVGIAASPSGAGYWLIASDGGVFTFGDAGFFGSDVGHTASPAVSLVPTADGAGYWIAHQDGSVVSHGNAPAAAASGRLAAGEHAVGITRDQSGNGYYLAGSAGTIVRAGDAPALAGAGKVANRVVAIGPAGLQDRSSAVRLLETDGTVLTVTANGVTSTSGPKPLAKAMTGFSQIFQ
jgi:hypothetical protein